MVDITTIPENTLLVMTPTGVPLYSTRGATQTLTPCTDAKPSPMRTINGELRFVGGSQMRKYESVINCTDQNPFAFGELWPGEEIVVDCIHELSYLSHTGEPEREPVEGSEHQVGDFTLYRPRITFLVVDFSQSFDEYQHMYTCQITLSEK